MKHLSRMLAAALLVGTLSVQAAVIITIQENGSDVVVAGKGTIDSLDGLTTAQATESGANQHLILPSYSSILSTSAGIPNWHGGSAPLSFATTNRRVLNTTVFSGSDFGISRLGIAIPYNYSLGDPIEFSMTFTNQTIDSMAMLVGTYMWTWGAGDLADFVQLCVGDIEPCQALPPEPPDPAAATPVPSLGAFGIFGLAGAISAAGFAMNRRRKAGK